MQPPLRGHLHHCPEPATGWRVTHRSGTVCACSSQVYNCINDYKRYLDDVGAALVVGGTDHNEVLASVRSGCDVIVATPGKITDLIKRGIVSHPT